jgi:hypothetical protein
MPASLNRLTWAGSTFAVMAMIGIDRTSPGRRRMRSVAAIPSMTGIWMSIRTRS